MLVEILQKLAITNRNTYYQKISTQSRPNNVRVINYETTTGLFRCRMETGEILFARPISNGSSISKGDIVNLIRTETGVPMIDAMPSS
ncbi:MAG: hypothetical protein QNJ36_19825 [Calothrix sp. MO_167.B42]|nr:hypothetical protein [Calothrix sp. MO_167.B42]